MMDMDIQKIVEKITREVINRMNTTEIISNDRKEVCCMSQDHVSIGRGSAYDLGPYADKMRKMMAERGNGPAIRRQMESCSERQSISANHHGSAYDYGTRL